MDFSPTSRGQNLDVPAKHIIDQCIPEGVRLARSSEPGHLDLLGKELGVKSILTRPMSSRQEQHPGIDAMLVPLPEGYSVVIDERASYSRRNFSLAHELAHIMVLETQSFVEDLPGAFKFRSSVSATDRWKAEERLCDAIAAELLMPERTFTVEAARFGSSLENLPRLANQFGASLTAAAIRYWELLPEPCQLIRWRTARGKNEAIRPTWQMRNKSAGLYICPITPTSMSRRNEFRTLRDTWKTLKTLVSHECLLVKHGTSGRHDIQPVTFEVEHIGFGGLNNRTILSAVYLDRISANA